MSILGEECRKHGIIYRQSDAFKYIHKFESKMGQLSLF
jgi:hypothetical protein